MFVRINYLEISLLKPLGCSTFSPGVHCVQPGFPLSHLKYVFAPTFSPGSHCIWPGFRLRLNFCLYTFYLNFRSCCRPVRRSLALPNVALRRLGEGGSLLPENDGLSSNPRLLGRSSFATNPADAILQQSLE